MPAHQVQPGAFKKALEEGRTEKARNVAHETVDALIALNQKAVNKKHGRRT